MQIYHGHSMDKTSGAKGDFRHESQMGHALGPSTTVVMYRQQMRQKKDVVYGLLLLHDSQILIYEPYKNPTHNICTYFIKIKLKININ